ncbi:MAG: nucleoside kinase [Alistipes sp.]|nr:nucleoside kinase [Alistipes sp.]
MNAVLKPTGRNDLAGLIAESEGRHSRRLSEIAEAIAEANRERGVRTVLEAGPSSSGKTTFARRLADSLAAKGIEPVPISIDDFFVERDNTPRDEHGNYDFETVEAVDLALLNDCLRRLSEGESVRIPLYDFVSGKRLWHEQALRLNDNSVMILEGLHALNPRLSNLIDDNRKYKIFISCLTPAESADGERISAFDVRLLRRISRDNAQRGRSAAQTIQQWAGVRRGEEKWVFPYLGDADAVFDSSLRYELSVLHPVARPLLEAIPQNSEEYRTASRLLRILNLFPPAPADGVPEYSLLREFIGL